MNEEKKTSYRGYTEAQKRATAKYMKANLDEFKIRVPKGKKEYYKSAADACGLSLNAFVVAAMDEKIDRQKDDKKTGENAKNNPGL